MLLMFLSRFRVLISGLSIALFIVLYGFFSMRYVPLSIPWLRLVDFSFWILSLGSCLAGFLDLYLFWRKSPLISTLLITIIGLSITFFARLLSVFYSLLMTSFSIQILGGSLTDEESFVMATGAVAGSFLILGSTSIHTIYKEPIIFLKSSTLYDLMNTLRNTLEKTKIHYMYVIIFAVGFLVRAYPEIKYIDRPIGWDTLEYISVSKDFVYQPKILTTYIWLGGYRNIPPLLTWVSGLTFLTGLDPWIFYKIYPPIMIGILSALSSAITFKITRSRIATFLTGLAIIFNPYIIGQSQQWHRHLLGLTILIGYIYLSEKKSRAWKRALTLALASLAYEPSAVISLITSLYETYISKDWRDRTIFISTSALSLLTLLWYIGYPKTPVATLTPAGAYVAGNIEYYPMNTIMYTLVSLLLLSPSIMILLIWRSIDVRARVIIVTLFIIFIMPVLSVIAPTDQHRWYMMLMTIITPYTIAVFSKIDRKILSLITIMIMLLGTAYIFTDNGYIYLRIWPAISISPAAGYPWKMTPSISNVSEIRKISDILINRSETTLVPLSLYPQLHTFIRDPKNLIAIQEDPSLITAISFMLLRNISKTILLTPVNITKQYVDFIEKPDLYNASLALQLGEKYKEIYIDIKMIKIETIYTEKTLSIYHIEINTS